MEVLHLGKVTFIIGQLVKLRNLKLTGIYTF